MAKKKNPAKLGMLHLRIDPELHRALAEVAAALGSDLSGVVKTALVEALPGLQFRVLCLRQAQEQVQRLVEGQNTDFEAFVKARAAEAQQQQRKAK